MRHSKRHKQNSSSSTTTDNNSSQQLLALYLPCIHQETGEVALFEINGDVQGAVAFVIW
jgi:hypothetical protein